MNKIRITKSNGNIIPCIIDIPENPKGIVIMIHGFTSCKECPTGELLFRRMIPAGIGVVCYDQPGHGTEEAQNDELRVTNCIESLKAVEEYIAESYPDTPVFYFGSSFGAYVTAIHISIGEHRGRKAFFRSAAVNMPELILGPEKRITDPMIQKMLDTYGYVEPDLGLGETLRLTKGFAEDLTAFDLFNMFDPAKYGNNAVEMVHGEIDDVVPLAAVKTFSEQFNIPLHIIAEDGHHLCEGNNPDVVADFAISFFLKP